MALAPQAKKCSVPPAQEAATPAAPPQGPTLANHIFSTVDELSVVSGERYDVFVDAVVVTVTEQGYENAIHDVSKKHGSKHRRAVEVIPGKYWRIGTFGGQPCFRQEAASGDGALNNLALFLYWCGKKDVAGWYISTDLKHGGQSELFAWAAERISGPVSVFPDKLHVPALATEPNTEVLIEALSAWSDCQYADLKGAYDAFVGGGVVAELIQAADEPDPEADVEDMDKGHGKDSGKGRDTGKHPKKNSSGWLNRSCPLVQACLDKEWDTAFAVAKSLAREPTMRTVLDKGIGYREMKGFKGKGKGGSSGSSWGAGSWSSSASSWY
jgi:hypothetical protein